MPDKDRIFSSMSDEVAPFRFDDKVAAVFPDMINRSVPGYAQTLAMIGLIAGQYAQPGSRLYDLGCSLGAASLAMLPAAREKSCRIIAVDNSPAMVKRCRQNTGESKQIDLICADILDVTIEGTSVVALNFVLQFITPEQRPLLLERIWRGLMPGGVLILSEKITFENEEENRRQIELHEAFKRAQGYSELEISSKRTALESVLIPETLACHHARLNEAGFATVLTWFQCFNFASMIAFKA